MLAKSKLYSIESLMSQALIDFSHEELWVKKNDQRKESIRNKKDGDEFSKNE